jgi:hypothetical protein
MTTEAGTRAKATRRIQRAGSWLRYKWQGFRGDHWFWPAVFTLVAAAVAALLILLGWITAGSRSDEVSLELVKTGLEIAAVVVLGSAVAAAFRTRDERRVDELRIGEYRAATLTELWAAYHRIKAVRRTLLPGFDKAKPGSSLSAKQSADFHAQMDVLNDAQLTLERLVREVEGQKQLFDQHGDCIAGLLGRAEHYVNGVIGDWEKHGLQVKEQADFAELAKRPDEKGRPSLGRLSAFIGDAKPKEDKVPPAEVHPAADCETRARRDWEGVKAGVSIPIERAAQLIQAARLHREPPPPPAGRDSAAGDA